MSEVYVNTRCVNGLTQLSYQIHRSWTKKTYAHW